MKKIIAAAALFVASSLFANTAPAPGAEVPPSVDSSSQQSVTSEVKSEGGKTKKKIEKKSNVKTETKSAQ